MLNLSKAKTLAAQQHHCSIDYENWNVWFIEFVRGSLDKNEHCFCLRCPHRAKWDKEWAPILPTHPLHHHRPNFFTTLFFFQSKKNLLKPFGGMLQSSLSQMRIFDKNPSSFFCARKLIIFLISFLKELLSLKLSLMAFKMS